MCQYKKNNHHHLTLEIQHVWNVKTKLLPLKIGVSGTIANSIRSLEKITVEYETKELQQTDMLGTAHIYRKLLMYKYRTSNMGNMTCIMNRKYKAAAKLHTLETWFVPGM
jgi:hypothetical protein